eukprot:TRINITY_DN2533_c0_g1_i1.p1 TRINITY_DN2533_c0_g1~~TRINITY_DN2533_c0_g1_i1.p1  ORF type:complete len:1306 (-),score=461.85 TRINITY_DN2533_c0_g1_i1:247-4164(-)
MEDWVLEQQQDLSSWVNHLLKQRNMEIKEDDLHGAFSDGLKLIHLVEILSGASVGRYNPNPRFPGQKLDNIRIALKFMEEKFDIKTIGIFPQDIMEGNVKRIMGLIFLLVNRFKRKNDGDIDVLDLSSTDRAKDYLLSPRKSPRSAVSTPRHHYTPTNHNLSPNGNSPSPSSPTKSTDRKHTRQQSDVTIKLNLTGGDHHHHHHQSSPQRSQNESTTPRPLPSIKSYLKIDENNQKEFSDGNPELPPLPSIPPPLPSIPTTSSDNSLADCSSPRRDKDTNGSSAPPLPSNPPPLPTSPSGRKIPPMKISLALENLQKDPSLDSDRSDLHRSPRNRAETPKDEETHDEDGNNEEDGVSVTLRVLNEGTETPRKKNKGSQKSSKPTKSSSDRKKRLSTQVLSTGSSSSGGESGVPSPRKTERSSSTDKLNSSGSKSSRHHYTPSNGSSSSRKSKMKSIVLSKSDDLVIDEALLKSIRSKEDLLCRLQACIKSKLHRIKHPREKSISTKIQDSKELMTSFIRLQAVCRSKRTRMHPPPQLSRMKRRLNIAREILTTEKTYVKGLHCLTDIYLKDLRTIPADVLPSQTAKTIFSNSEVIYKYNTLILSQIQKRMENWYREKMQIGDIFVKMADFLKVYTAYVNNYNQAFQSIIQYSSHPIVQASLVKSQQHEEVNGMDLMSFLIMPVQRLPRYVLLLRDLLKNTEEHETDFALLSKAVEKMSSVADYVNDKKREAENLNAVSLISKLLVGSTELVKTSRHFVRQGPLYAIEDDNININSMHTTVKNNTSKLRYIFLFNDLLLTSKRNEDLFNKLTGRVFKGDDDGGTATFTLEDLQGNADLQFKLISSLSLDQVELVDAEKILEVTAPSIENPFVIKDADSEKVRIIYSTNDKSSKFSFMKDIDDAIRLRLNARRTMVLGDNPSHSSDDSATLDKKAVTKTGYLHKLNKTGEWKVKLCEIVGTQFRWFRKENFKEGVPPSGCIPVLTSDIKLLINTEKKNTFSIEFPRKNKKDEMEQRVYTFMCQSGTDRTEWVNGLRQIIRKFIEKSEKEHAAAAAAAAASPSSSPPSIATTSPNTNNAPSTPSKHHEKQDSTAGLQTPKDKSKTDSNNSKVSSPSTTTSSSSSSNPSSQQTLNVPESPSAASRTAKSISKKLRQNSTRLLKTPAKKKKGIYRQVQSHPTPIFKKYTGSFKDKKLQLQDKEKKEVVAMLELGDLDTTIHEVSTQNMTLYTISMLSEGSKEVLGTESEDDINEWIDRLLREKEKDPSSSSSSSLASSTSSTTSTTSSSSKPEKERSGSLISLNEKKKKS